ncbi:PEGA domain-containing protein [Haliangium sp.]|uniref:PEGA domain-containing protein n=1 Tax=Haliangium sp. TaxID=2663208 RepID=UPI003D0C3224
MEVRESHASLNGRRRRRLGMSVACAVLALTWTATSARAQSAPEAMDADGLGEGDGPRPWAENVSAEDQAKARALFKEGNALIRESRIPEAIAKYQEAIEHWDHPGIHYNLSFALIDQKESVAAYHSLQKAIAYGAGPIGEARVARAQERLELVRGQLATIVIACDEPGARVTLNGRSVLTGPGEYEELVLVGEYQVAASKSGYLPETRDVVLTAEETERVELELFTVDDMTYSKRRWSAWMPWAVVGAGATVLAVGGGLHANARSNFSSYDGDFDMLCAEGGCRDEEVPQLTDRLDSATNKQRIAFVSYALGSAVLAGGLVMVYLNQPQVFRRDEVDGQERTLTVVPALSPESVGVSALLRF